jgi:antitoxin CptB
MNAHDDIAIRRRRLIFRSWHRGTKEMDLLLGRFADAHIPHFDSDRLAHYETLLLEPDPDLYNWIVKRETPPADKASPVLLDIIAFHNPH